MIGGYLLSFWWMPLKLHGGSFIERTSLFSDCYIPIKLGKDLVKELQLFIQANAQGLLSKQSQGP